MDQILPISDYQEACGERLRRLIDLIDVTYVEAAKIMGVSKHVLRNWMAGENPVQAYPLYRLCRSKGINFDYVFLGDWSALPHSVGKAVEEAVMKAADAALAVPTDAEKASSGA